MMLRHLCRFLPHKLARLTSETTYITFPHGEQFRSRFAWSECVRCGKRIGEVRTTTFPTVKKFG